MVDRTTDKFYTTRPRAGRDSFRIADGVTVAAGTLVQSQVGYANHWDDSAEPFLGLVIGGDDRAGAGVIIGEVTDSPMPDVHVDTSGAILTGLTVNGTPTRAKVGDYVYCVDSDPDNITLNSSGRTSVIGWMVRYVSTTSQEVQLFTPAEWMAYNIESPN